MHSRLFCHFQANKYYLPLLYLGMWKNRFTTKTLNFWPKNYFRLTANQLALAPLAMGSGNFEPSQRTLF